MTTRERRASRTLSPIQIRAIALRVQGLDITTIAREVGRDRTATSRWFATDPEGYRNSDSAYDLHLPSHLRRDAVSRGERWDPCPRGRWESGASGSLSAWC
jgi:hypothetical protein